MLSKLSIMTLGCLFASFTLTGELFADVKGNAFTISKIASCQDCESDCDHENETQVRDDCGTDNQEVSQSDEAAPESPSPRESARYAHAWKVHRHFPEHKYLHAQSLIAEEEETTTTETKALLFSAIEEDVVEPVDGERIFCENGKKLNPKYICGNATLA